MSEYRFDLRKQYPLDGKGTRWEHYAELREVFALGISVIESTKEAYRSDLDNKKLSKLKNAVEMIDQRLALLSGYDEQNRSWGDFDQMLRKLEMEKMEGKAGWVKGMKPSLLLTEGKPNEQAAPKDISGNSTPKDSQPPPDDPVGV